MYDIPDNNKNQHADKFWKENFTEAFDSSKLKKSRFFYQDNQSMSPSTYLIRVFNQE